MMESQDKRLTLFVCATGFNIEDLINVTSLQGGKLVTVAQNTNETPRQG